MVAGSFSITLPLLAIACFTGGIGFLAFHRSKQTGAITLGWLMTSLTVWGLLYAVEIQASTFSEKILAAKLLYVGMAPTSPLWLTLAMEYTGHTNWLKRGTRLALVGITAVTIVLALTNQYHHLIYSDARIEPSHFPGAVVFEHGPWFWIFIAFSYILIIGGIAAYLTAYLRARSPFRKTIGLMAFASFIPLAGNFSSVFFSALLRGLDITPFTFAITGTLMAFGILRYNLLDLMPIAATLVIENLSDPVIVIDKQMRVVDINAAGRTWLKAGNEVIGRDAREVFLPLEPIWKEWGTATPRCRVEIGDQEPSRWFDVTISRLQGANGQRLGNAIVVRDISLEQTLLKSELRRARQMEILNFITRLGLETPSFEAMLDTLAEHLGRLLDADGAFITLWDDAKQQVIPTSAYGEYRTTYKNMELDPGENTLSAYVLRERRTLAVEDVRHTPYMNPHLADDVPTQSVLAMPLITNERKLGAALICFNQRHLFTTEEIAIGEQAAAQLSLALDKSQLLDIVSHRVVQLSLLQDVSVRLAGSLEENAILQLAVQSIVEALGYDEAAICLLVGENILELAAIGGVKDMGFAPGFRQNMGQGIIGHVAETRQPYFTIDIVRDPYYYHPSGLGTGAAMGIPMLLEGQLFGVIYIQNAQPNSIRVEDTQTLEALANHLVLAIQKARLYASARDHLLTMTTIQSVTQTITSSLELNHTFSTVVRLLKENFGYNYVSIYLLDGSRLRLGAQIGYAEEQVIYEIPVTSGVIGRTVRTRQLQFIRNVRDDPDFLRASYEVESEICAPLLKEDCILGVLNIEFGSSRPPNEKDVELLIAIAGPVALAIDNARLHAKVTALALTDSMTGLINRRAFDQTLETEVARAARYGHPLSLIIIDLDSFKCYNDTYGHPAGDERLKVLASLLISNVRYPDSAARYGGEEFALILPHTNKSGALTLAERLRAAAESLASEELDHNGVIAGYTISLGVASFPEDGDTSAALLLAADNAELTAKRLGKNRVCAAGRRRENAQDTAR